MRNMQTLIKFSFPKGIPFAISFPSFLQVLLTPTLLTGGSDEKYAVHDKNFSKR